MSLCSLIYKTCKLIADAVDLTEIMRTGNELYSVLSRSTGQTYLLLAELPNMMSMLNNNYQLELLLHAVTLNENIPGVMPLQHAVQNLMQVGYTSFLLTIGCNTVSIYINSDGIFKLFDSHGRDAYGKSDSRRT